MKFFLIILFLGSFKFVTFGQQWPQTIDYPSRNVYLVNRIECPLEEWTLVFSDEFDGNTLNQNKWRTSFPYPPPYDRLHGFLTNSTVPCEQQLYLDQNVVVENGFCHLLAKKESITYGGITVPFTAGMIHTKDPHKYKYGKFEIRCKIPNGNGFWPAFWMWGGHEIDVFEIENNDPELIHCTIHRDGKKWGEAFDSGLNLTADFHTYTVIWEREHITWLLDGNIIRRVPRYFTTLGQPVYWCPVHPGSYTEILLPNTEMNVIANFAIGGNCSGFGCCTDDSTPFPSEMLIDYIKVWQRIPSGSSGDLRFKAWSGPDIICDGSNGTINITGNTQGMSTYWTTSSNLDIVSSANNQIIVASNGSGSAWVKAEIITGDCPNTALQKNMWLGLPATPQFTYFNYPCDPVEICLTNWSLVNQYEWSSNQNILMNYGQCIIIGDFHHPAENPTFINFDVNVTNNCGAVMYHGSVLTKECEGQNYRLSISPNPATGVIHVKLLVEGGQENLNESYHIQVLDNCQNIALNHTTQILENTFSIGDLGNGIYTIKAFNANFSASSILVIQN
jgi:beta-glucanase (GH16 family)